MLIQSISFFLKPFTKQISEQLTLNPFADNSSDSIQMMVIVRKSVENNVGKGEKNQHYLLFAQCFQKLFLMSLFSSLPHNPSF